VVPSILYNTQLPLPRATTANWQRDPGSPTVRHGKDMRQKRERLMKQHQSGLQTTPQPQYSAEDKNSGAIPDRAAVHSLLAGLEQHQPHRARPPGQFLRTSAALTTVTCRSSATRTRSSISRRRSASISVEKTFPVGLTSRASASVKRPVPAPTSAIL
jgi:hypothetical protein